jgi:hypothetical protein
MPMLLETSYPSSARTRQAARVRAEAPRITAAWVAVAFGAGVLAAPLRDARADNVSSSGKGITGGGLLGAEVVTIVESIIGVRAGWAYVVGALVGAGGGAAGGYAVEQGSTDGKAPTYMLAGGLALVIPAIVLTLNATRYQPEEGAAEDRVPVGPAAEPGAQGGSVSGTPDQGGAPVPGPASPPSPPPAAPVGTPSGSQGSPSPTPTPPPQSLLDVRPGRLRMGVPMPNFVPTFTASELRQYGMKRSDTELRMPVLHVVF